MAIVPGWAMGRKPVVIASLSWSPEQRHIPQVERGSLGKNDTRIWCLQGHVLSLLATNLRSGLALTRPQTNHGASQTSFRVACSGTTPHHITVGKPFRVKSSHYRFHSKTSWIIIWRNLRTLRDSVKHQ